MITLEEIKKKTLRIWDSGRFLKAWCGKENIFPIDIPFGRISGSGISDNYHDVSKSIERLTESSKQKTGYGYSIEFKAVSHRQLGKQNIPERIFIETDGDFLKLCGKQDEYKTFTDLFFKTEKILPALSGFIPDNPLTLIQHRSEWEKLLQVCIFFLENPKPSLYIRQIVIHGIDTKFIESNKKILTELLIFLKPERYGRPLPSPSQNRFENLFGLLYDEPLVRFRILDENSYIQNLSDITLPLSQFAALDIPAEKVFITENKINGLSFPMTRKSIVIFGLGYGIQILKEIPWLREREIFYWGDIDTHGFSILSMAREILPQCRSFLMDKETLTAHRESWVQEGEGKRFTGKLSSLHEDETKLFEDLKSNKYGINVRLEQELIGYDFLLKNLKEI